MRWTLLDRGFLPTPDPLTSLGDGRVAAAEELGRRLPELVASRKFREEAPRALVGFTVPEEYSAGGAEAERLFLLFSYFASAYVHLPGAEEARSIPTEIAGPMVKLAGVVGRPPILAYASYCLHNWRRLDANGPIALGNIELTQNFAAGENGKEDEDWFILVHVDIEARAGTGMQALVRAGKGVQVGDAGEAERGLEGLAASLREMNRTMNRMPERCRPEVYFLKVRPYIFGFNGVVYEGYFGGAPQSLRGETGAQSSIVPSLLVGLGIKHKNSMLTTHLEDMRNYMPPAHREFILSRVDVRPFVVEAAGRGDAQGKRLRDLYNECLAEVIAFRSRHFDYAVNYIERRVDNPLATGGTPYISWLKQLIEETRAYHVE